MESVRCWIHLRNRQMVPLEEDSRGSDVAVREELRRRLSVERFEVVDVEDRVALWVSGVRVR